MTHTKQFIHEFNFPNPNWSSLPSGFPNLKKDGLTKEESHLLDGIKLAWMNSKAGKDHIRRKCIKSGKFGTFQIAVAIIIYLAVSFLGNPDRQYTKSVNAATISATLKQISQGSPTMLEFEEFVESTKSAIFKGN